jgi:hypothetical protein
MPGSCGCAGQQCSCLIEAGAGITISGTGVLTNPYQITATTSDINGLVTVVDTSTLNLTLAGSGSDADPFRISGVVTLPMTGLTDVGGAAPTTGQVPTWVTAAGGNPARFEFRTPASGGGGTVTAGAGLTGDGAAGTPLTLRTSGTWGSGVLSGLGSDSTIGAVVYVDAGGLVRAMPRGVDVVANSGATKPAQYPGRMYVQADTSQLFWSNGAVWAAVSGTGSGGSVSWASITDKPTVFPPEIGSTATTAAAGNHTHDATAITSGVLPIARGGTGATTAAAALTALGGAALPAGATGRVVTDVTGANVIGLRWNGRPVIRVDSSEITLPTIDDLSFTNANVTAVSNRVGTLEGTRANGYGDLNTVRYAEGPNGTAYNRSVSGSGFFQVWMDAGLQFGRNTSSRRYKDEIAPYEVPEAAVTALGDAVRSFHRIGTPEGVYEVGVIAEEVNEYAPWAVSWAKDEDGVERIETVRYDLLALIPAVGVARLYERIEVLDRRLAQLEGR